MGKREGKRKGKKEDKVFREIMSNFSLDFPEIGQTVFDETRSKVDPQSRATRGYQFCGVSTNFER